MTHEQREKLKASIAVFPGDSWPDAFIIEGMLLRDVGHCRGRGRESCWAGGTLASAKAIAAVPELLSEVLEAHDKVEEMARRAEAAETKAESLQRQLDAVDSHIGFPDGSGRGRIETIEHLTPAPGEPSDDLMLVMNSMGDVTKLNHFAASVDPVRLVATWQEALREVLRKVRTLETENAYLKGAMNVRG